MDEVVVETIEEPALDSPVLIEGLPGVAHVGALAAEHLVEEFPATLVRRVYSEHFPPQVMVEDESTRLTASEVYAVELGEHHVLVLVGDHQPQTPVGHYRVTEAYLDIASSLGVERVVAMGGVPTGELIDEYEVLAVASDDELLDGLVEAGATVRPDEPAGGIIGVSGLLVGMGERRGFDAACLMGETSGYLVDPKSATQLLLVLESWLGFEVDTGSLDERAEEMEEVIGRIQEMESQPQFEVPSDEDLRYIG